MRIAVAGVTKSAYSETFIENHIRYLPAEIHVIYGQDRTTFASPVSGELLIPPLRLLPHMKWTASRVLSGETWNSFRDQYIVRYLQDKKIDIVLAEFGVTGREIMHACLTAGIPLVVNFHGYDAYREDVIGRSRNGYDELFEIASALIVVSKHMEMQLASLGAPSEKLWYVPYGIDFDQFAGASPGLSEPVFLSVGRFVNKKGPLLTILAFRLALDKVPGLRLIMIGDGYLLEAAKRLSEYYRLTDHIDCVGVQPHSRVAEIMKISRAFVQHSVVAHNNDHEGTPVAILEASGAGLPIIATEHAGIPEVVIHGESGFLVAEGDVEGMANYIIALATDPELAAKMGTVGRRNTVNKHSIDSSMARYMDIFSSVINKENRGQG